MQNAEKKANGVQGATAKNNNSSKTLNRPSLTGKETKNEPVKNQTLAKVEETATAKTAGVTTHCPDPVVNESGNAKEPAASEVNNGDQKPVEQPKEENKPELSLEAKLEAVEDLHRKTIQRLALIGRIETLKAFEVKLIEESDELESNIYSGCKLIIKDDKGREFVTNTPNLIRMVSQYVYDACFTKLEEIESIINFPQA